MGSRYLTDLAEVCRRAVPQVMEVDGWQTRARGSGGYDTGRPTHVMVHHTASGPSSDGWPDVDYCTFGDDDAPLCNLYLDRAGVVYVCAAGATNTNGSGQDPCGVTADDAMNGSALGVEAGNDGVSEAWPAAQQDAYVALCRELCAAYGIAPAQVHGHAEYAAARKVDPAGPSRWASTGTWYMTAFRDEVASSSSPPPIGDDDVTDEDIQKITANVTAAVVAQLPNAVWDVVLGPAYGVGPAPAKTWVTDTRVVAGQIVAAVDPAADPEVQT